MISDVSLSLKPILFVFGDPGYRNEIKKNPNKFWNIVLLGIWDLEILKILAVRVPHVMNILEFNRHSEMLKLINSVFVQMKLCNFETWENSNFWNLYISIFETLQLWNQETFYSQVRMHFPDCVSHRKIVFVRAPLIYECACMYHTKNGFGVVFEKARLFLFFRTVQRSSIWRCVRNLWNFPFLQLSFAMEPQTLSIAQT